MSFHNKTLINEKKIQVTVEHPWDDIIRFVCLNDTGVHECGLGTGSNNVGRKLGSLVGLMTQGGD